MSGSRYRFSADMSRAEELETQNLLAEQVQALEDAGSGTVTTVSVVTANGVSGSVANPTTTPAITVTLGAITPSSVNASGTVVGSNLSGTNTGDQTAANPTATASDAAVNGVAATFMRSDAAPAIQKASSSVFGVVKVDGTSITASGGVISAPGAGGGTVTTTGSPASGNLAKFSGATSIVNGDLSGDVTTSGTLAVTIANDAVTYAKMQNVSAASKVLGRGSAGGSGDPEELSVGLGLEISSTTIRRATGTSFPGSPATGDIFWRSDRNIEYVYDGTRWLSTQIFSVEIPAGVPGGAGIATGTASGYIPVPYKGTYSLYITEVDFVTFADATSTWSYSWVWRDSANNQNILVAAPTTATTTTWVFSSGAVNAVLSTSAFLFSTGATRNTGSGLLYCGAVMKYRLVG